MSTPGEQQYKQKDFLFFSPDIVPAPGPSQIQPCAGMPAQAALSGGAPPWPSGDPHQTDMCVAAGQKKTPPSSKRPFVVGLERRGA